MIIQRHVVIVGLLVAACCATSAGRAGWAQTGSANIPMIVSGRITSVDLKQNLVTLKIGFFATQTFAVDAEAKIIANERRLPLERLQPGADVLIEYLDEHGQHIAQSITVKGHPPVQERARARP